MDDDVEILGDIEVLLAGIESGWEMQMFYERRERLPMPPLLHELRETPRLDPQPLEDLEPEHDEDSSGGGGSHAV